MIAAAPSAIPATATAATAAAAGAESSASESETAARRRGSDCSGDAAAELQKLRRSL